ncbi:unnamed protein product [Lactuca saligna]|uniref:Uncharacterized protein n=1 Tax=Lactuca saligna TaxID=75948 RepID=A0AA36EA29_LACSI|nr:unnamed protein product [Lactuca saligna]
MCMRWKKVRFIQKIENLQGRIAITTDMWTSTNQKKGFMAITCHYIHDWCLQSKILRFVYVPCPHTIGCGKLLTKMKVCNLPQIIMQLFLMITTQTVKLDGEYMINDGSMRKLELKFV